MSGLRCPTCGSDIPEDALYCEQCGVGVPPTCPACDRQNNAGSRYCRFCRSSLDSDAVGPAGARRGPPALTRPVISPSVFVTGRRIARSFLARLDKKDRSELEAWQSTLAELVGTMLFVFFGAGAVVVSGTMTDGELTIGRLVTIALAHGLAISVLVYATANISDGHLNPAVTFGAIITRNIEPAKGLSFVLAQVVGAAFGALLIAATLPNAMDESVGAHTLAPGVPILRGLVLEAVITFALVFIVFATAIDRKGMGRWAPLAIGLTVLVGSVVAVPVTGASMNPARSMGPALVAAQWSGLWLYWVGPLVGGALAGLGYEYLFIRRPGKPPGAAP